MTRRLLLLLLLLLPVALFAQTPVSNPGDPQRVRLLVDMQDNSGWKPVDAAHVFEKGDRVRFRVSVNFPGYLYVMNQGTSGAYELLFPRSDTGSDNRIDANKEYIVPAVQGYFKVDGPAGQDVVYWLVSPVELTRQYKPLPPPPPMPPPSGSLRPRCDDSVFKARGECVDTTAGVKPVKPGAQIPENLAGVAGATPRELLFIQEKGGVVLSSRTPLSGPVIYELRLAHR